MIGITLAIVTVKLYVRRQQILRQQEHSACCSIVGRVRIQYPPLNRRAAISAVYTEINVAVGDIIAALALFLFFCRSTDPTCTKLDGRAVIIRQHNSIRLGRYSIQQLFQCGSNFHVTEEIKFIYFLVRKLRFCIVNGIQLGLYFFCITFPDIFHIRQCVDHSLHARHSDSFGIRRGSCFHVIIHTTYLAVKFAGCSPGSGGIATFIIMFMPTVQFL